MQAAEIGRRTENSNLILHKPVTYVKHNREAGKVGKYPGLKDEKTGRSYQPLQFGRPSPLPRYRLHKSGLRLFRRLQLQSEVA